MTTTEALPTAPSRALLRVALTGNAVFSAVSGIVLAVLPGTFAALVGFDAPFVLALLGIVLVLYGIGLFLAARQQPIRRDVAWTAIALDDAWVVGSIALLLFAPDLLTPVGEWLVGIVAIAVAGFAIAQWLGVRNT